MKTEMLTFEEWKQQGKPGIELTPETMAGLLIPCAMDLEDTMQERRKVARIALGLHA